MFPLSAPFCLARVSFLFPSGFPSGLPIADDSEVVSVDPVFELTRSGLFLDPGLGMFGYVGEIRERFIADHCHVLSLLFLGDFIGAPHDQLVRNDLIVQVLLVVDGVPRGILGM